MGFYAPQPSAHADYAVALSPFYFSHLIKVQLTPDNYLSWRALLLPLLRSRYMEGYVDGSLPCPPPSHPAYHTWVAQDQAILSAIQSSLTPSVSSLVLFATTSRDAWMALHTSFASQSQARAHAIRTELAETKLCDLSITDYFNKMTGLADTLASIGQPLRSEDFTTYILNGLDEDYDNLVENINGRDTPLQPHELYSRLLGREQRVKARHASPSFSSANAAACGKPQKPSPTSGKPASAPPQAPWAAAPSITGGGRPHACCPCCGAHKLLVSCVALMAISPHIVIDASSRTSSALATMEKATTSRLLLPWWVRNTDTPRPTPLICRGMRTLMRRGVDGFSPSSWEPQEEGMMSIAASFSLRKKPRFIKSRKKSIL
jgi:hypothetical protein